MSLTAGGTRPFSLQFKSWAAESGATAELGSQQLILSHDGEFLSVLHPKVGNAQAVTITGQA
jgi:hypothetical protein